MPVKSAIFLLIFLFFRTQEAFCQQSNKIDTLEELNDTPASVRKPLHIDSVAIIQPSTRTDSLLSYAYTFLGNRYRRGGTTQKGFDCSGYTMTVFRKFGIKLPHTSAGQGLMGYPITKQNIQKGDLVFFRGRSRRGSRIGHVGIVISSKGEPVRFIHSSTSEGVRIDRLDFLYYKKRYLKAVRIPELHKN